MTGIALNQQLSEARSIPIVLAQDINIQSALARFGPDIRASRLPPAERSAAWRADPALAAIAKHLGHIVATFDLNTAWITNAAGDAVAEGHAPGMTPFTGTNYADRDYFKAAQSGQNGRQFAIGRVTNTYSLFYSSPVLVNGKFIGMVGSAFRLPKLAPMIESIHIFVADENGVIVLAHDPDWLMQSVPGGKVTYLSADQRDKRYKRQDFKVIDLEALTVDGQNGLFRWQQHGTYVLAKHAAPESPLQVLVLRDLGESLDEIRTERWVWFALVSLAVIFFSALMGGGALYARTKRQQQEALLRLNKLLDQQANTDTLTGCPNRRHFMKSLEAELHRSQRYGLMFCLLSLDIDFFKHVNDRYGHAAGDEVLRQFVSIAQRRLRKTDLLGRVGGEEFLILLPQTSAEGGALIAERIRQDVQESISTFNDQPIPITVSIGGLPWKPGDTAIQADDVLIRCDQALYRAKNTGRNCVVWDRPSAA